MLKLKYLKVKQTTHILDTANPIPGLETTEGEMPDDIGNREGTNVNPYDVGYAGDGKNFKTRSYLL